MRKLSGEGDRMAGTIWIRKTRLIFAATFCNSDYESWQVSFWGVENGKI